MLSDYEKKIALGFTWSPPEQLHIPNLGKDAPLSWGENIPAFAASALRTLEGIKASDEDAKTIIDRCMGVSSLSTFDIRTVENFGQACGALFDMSKTVLPSKDCKTRNRTYNKNDICMLHALLSRDEVRNPGRFRRGGVKLEGCAYVPPPAESLEGIFANGFVSLDAIENVPERAIATFLFLCRSQFFENGNKRVASLVMTGTLITNGYGAIKFTEAGFMPRLADFYESGDGTRIFESFNKMGQEQYPDTLLGGYPDFVPTVYDR